MKILVIGHTVKDIIDTGNKIVTKPGGIFYAATGFYTLKQKGDEIFLLTNIDELSGDLFAESLFGNLYSHLNLKYSSKGEIITVHLKTFGTKEREEIYENLGDSLSIETLPDNLNDFDGIFLSMITGFDITLKNLLLIRSKYKGIIYCDIHSLSRGIDKNNKRYFRKIPEWEKWLSNFDIIQTNEYEIKSISDKNSEKKIAEDILNAGPKILIITKGKRGVKAYKKQGDEIYSLFIPAIKINSVNNVGCGDIFGASFFYSYISSQNFLDSIRYANCAAGISTTYADFIQYKQLKNDIITRLY